MKYGKIIGAVLAVMILGGVAVEYTLPHLVHQGNTVDTWEELGMKMNDELEQGKDHFYVYTKGFSEASLSSMNQQIDGFMGSAKTYTIMRRMGSQVFHVKIELEVSKNYYVYQSIVNGQPNTNPQVLELENQVRELMDATVGMTDVEKVIFFHDYIVQHTEYGLISGQEESLSYQAEGALIHGKAVCNGYAEAMELLLKCSGIESCMVIGKADLEDHAWNMVKLNGNWYHVDATWDDPVPDEEGRKLHVYLGVNDDIIGRTHVWNKKAYPSCTSLEENYYRITGKAFSDLPSLKVYVLKHMREEQQMDLMLEGDADDFPLDFIVNEGKAKSLDWTSYEGEGYTVIDIRIEK